MVLRISGSLHTCWYKRCIHINLKIINSRFPFPKSNLYSMFPNGNIGRSATSKFMANAVCVAERTCFVVIH